MRLLAISFVLMLAGCGDRRTFDERYDNTSAQLEKKAQQLDRNLTEAPANGS